MDFFRIFFFLSLSFLKILDFCIGKSFSGSCHCYTEKDYLFLQPVASSKNAIKLAAGGMKLLCCWLRSAFPIKRFNFIAREKLSKRNSRIPCTADGVESSLLIWSQALQHFKIPTARSEWNSFFIAIRCATQAKFFLSELPILHSLLHSRTIAMAEKLFAAEKCCK